MNWMFLLLLELEMLEKWQDMITYEEGLQLRKKRSNLYLKGVDS